MGGGTSVPGSTQLPVAALVTALVMASVLCASRAGLVCMSPILRVQRSHLLHAENDRTSHLKYLCDTVANTAGNPNMLFYKCT